MRGRRVVIPDFALMSFVKSISQAIWPRQSLPENAGWSCKGGGEA